MDEMFNILIVEDEKILALDLKNRICKLGYNVISVVATGEEAIKICSEERVNLILMDIILKGKIDGIEASRQIKLNYDIPIIYLTASSDSKSFQRAKLTEPCGYLIKPYDMKDLATTIELAIYKNKIDRKLKENELWLSSILASIDEGIIATDQNNKIKYINKTAAKIIDAETENLVDKDLDEVYRVIHDLTPESLICASRNSINNSGIEELMQRKILVSNKGNQIPIKESKAQITDRNGKVLGTVITCLDLRKILDDEMTVTAARDYYLLLFEEIPTPIWRVNAQGQFNFFNKSWLNFSGRKIEEEVALGWTNNLHPDNQKEFEESFQTAFSNKDKFEAEFRLLDANNNYKWLVCVANPFYDIKNEFQGYIGVCFDFTNRITMEEELKRSKEIAEYASKAKSSFISNMSHELRTPLNGIFGLIDLLMDTKPNKEQSEYLGMVKHASDTLLFLLNNLLDYSKFESGKENLKEEKINLDEMLTGIHKSFLGFARTKQIDLKLIKDDDLPEFLIGDVGKLKQIFNNLLGNAIKFTDKGEVILSCKNERKINSDKGNKVQTLHFIVKDTGIGISEDKFDIIFQDFMQIDNSSTRKYSGSGLGLSLVKKYVDLMNGKIWVESKPGSGSTFHLVIKFETPYLNGNTHQSQENYTKR